MTYPLQDASWLGIPFHVRTVEDQWKRRIAEHRYPGRDGAELEDMGREPVPVRFQAIFWGADYQQRLRELLDAFERAEVGTLVHPVLGSMSARCVGMRNRHSFEELDAVSVDLEFLEDQIDRSAFEVVTDTLAVLTFNATRAADLATLEVESAGNSLSQTAEETVEAEAATARHAKTETLAAIATARLVIARLEAEVKSLTALQVERVVGDARKALNASLLLLEETYGLDAQPAMAGLQDLGGALRDLAAHVIEGGAPLIEWTVPADLPIAAIAHHLYGDLNRADELLQLNQLGNPNRLLAGQVLKVKAS